MASSDKTEDTLVSASIKQIFLDLLKEQGITVNNVNIKSGTMKGDNYAGIIAQAEVTGIDKDGIDINNSYIIKSAPRSEVIRMFAAVRIAYAREIYIYTKVLPCFEKFQTEHNIKNKFTSYVQYLTSSYEDKDEALIMTDMRTQGYRMQNRKQPLDYNHVRLVIHELARYHALSFALRDQEPETFAELSKNMMTNYFDEMNKEGFGRIANDHCNRALKTLNPDTDQEVIEKFKTFQGKVLDDFVSVLQDQCHPHSVVRHGDCWTNNFLFKYRDEANPKEPTNMCFLDWQQAMVGPPVLDLLYFIYVCTDQDLREERYYQLLKDYHQALEEFTKELGTDIDKYYSFDTLMKHMKIYGKHGLTLAIMLLPLLLVEMDEIPNMEEVFNKEMDEEKMMEAFKFEMKNAGAYSKRMRDTILHCVENGFI